MEQDQYSSPETVGSKPLMYSHYSQAGNMAQGGYGGMPQDPNFHAGMGGQMGQRMAYPILRMPARPGLRPGGPVPGQPTNLRLQLQHRLQSQLVGHTPWLQPLKQADSNVSVSVSTFRILPA